MSLPQYITKDPRGGFKIDIWVQPGAKNTGIEGPYQGYLKIKLKSPPVDNKANKELISFLAKSLSLKSRQVQIKNGHSSRKKQIYIHTDKEPDWKPFLTA